jgi:GMP synthase-like glutamine amidotransferase
MRLHYFQHVPFENPAFLLSWAEKKGHPITKTLLYTGDDPLAAPDYDLLVIMGGPMNIYEYDKYPWLKAEKAAIKEAIADDKFVLGICLGGQLIADVLGGKVTQNPQKEIGWLPVAQTQEIAAISPFDIFPQEYMAFHWHGDTFALPPGAMLQSSTVACKNQGFLYKKRVIGFQYHIEATEQSVGALVDNCGEELVSAPYIHTPERIRKDTKQYQKTANQLIERMLEEWIVQ